VVTTITFATQIARFIKVTQTGSVSGLWWSIHEFNVLGAMGTPPGAPTGLAAAAGDGQVVLSWNSSSGANGYNVKRSGTSNGVYLVIATNLSTLGFSNSGLTDGTMYYFVVSATNAAGESANSPPVGAQPVSLAPPLVSFTPGAGQVQIAWPQNHTGWALQVQTNSAGGGLGINWVTLLSSQTTNETVFPIDPSRGSVFFRLFHAHP
jgi:fibronectin type 3 domain-containing protein